jgi:hypothetical protein
MGDVRKTAIRLAAMLVTLGWLAALAYLRSRVGNVDFESIEDPDDVGIDRAPEINVWSREFHGARRWT